MSKQKIKWATLQPLCGGMSIGYEQAIGHPPEFIITSGISNDEHYINYVNNVHNSNVPIIYMDGTYSEFQTPDDKKLFEKLNKKIDIVAYVPVCAGLSMLNTQVADKNATKGRGNADNIQNQNMYQCTHMILEMINPRVACFENAPAAYTKMGAGVAKRLREISEQHNYAMSMEKTDTFLHGIPQRRKRTFIYFWNDTSAPYIKYQHVETPELSEFFNEIPEKSNEELYIFDKYHVQSVDYEYILEHYGQPGDRLKDVFEREYPDYVTLSCLQFIRWKDDFQKAADWCEKRLKKLDPESKEYKRVKRFQQRYNHCIEKLKNNKGYWDSSTNICFKNTGVNAVVNRNFRGLMHPDIDRSMTIREIYWLMGLPHDYNLLNEKTRYKQVAQSVPVHTAKHTAEQCVAYVQGKLEKSNSRFIKQNNELQRVEYRDEDEREDIDLSSFF